MKLAIHQPNLVPWYPLFQKMAAVDVFVVLHHVQFTKNGYQNRFQYRGKWHTLSVQGGDSKATIAEKRYARPEEDWAAIERRLPDHPFLRELRPHLGTSIATTNTAILRHIAQHLGLRTRIVLDFPAEATGTERLVLLCRHFGATTYLAGRSGAHYMDLSLFEKAGIAVEFQTVAPEDQISVLEKLCP